MTQRLSTAWTGGIKDPTVKAKATEAILVSLDSAAMKQLRRILTERMDTIVREDTNPDAYDNPAWAHKQAFNNGRMSELRTILNLITSPN